jgi:hypothetical protein
MRARFDFGPPLSAPLDGSQCDREQARQLYDAGFGPGTPVRRAATGWIQTRYELSARATSCRGTGSEFTARERYLRRRRSEINVAT